MHASIAQPSSTVVKTFLGNFFFVSAQSLSVSLFGHCRIFTSVITPLVFPGSGYHLDVTSPVTWDIAK